MATMTEHDDLREATTGGPARSPSDLAVWRQRDLGWEALVEEARRIGPDPALVAIGDDDLEREVCTIAAQLAALTARWLGLLSELVVRGIWADQGARTPAQWLSWRLGMAPSTAREHVRIALRLRELPRVREAFAAGVLSYSKVRAITRIAIPELEDLLLRWADNATGAQLERIAADLRATRRAVEDGGDVAEPGDDAHYGWRERSHADGTVTISLRCPAEEAAELRARLERRLDLAAEDAETREGVHTATSGSGDVRDEVSGDGPNPPEPPRHRTADLVRELLHVVVCAGDGEPSDTSGLDRHTLVLHAPAEALRGGDEPGIVAVDDPRRQLRAMDRRVLRRLACEAGIVLAAVDERGSPIGIGRRDRRLTVTLRRALRLRDRTCRFPGCDATRHLHGHHVHHWADGGPTDLDNLVLLCAHHHRFVHEHGWDIEVRPDGLHRFRRRDGGPVDHRQTIGPAHAPSPVAPPDDPDALRPSYCEIPLPPGSRDVIAAVLDQELRHLAPDLIAA